jgi:hypothetical protein
MGASAQALLNLDFWGLGLKIMQQQVISITINKYLST